MDDVGDIAKYSKLIGNSPLYGFDSFGQLKQFGAKIYNTFTKKGYKEVKVYMQGSSVTGRNSKSGDLFDVDRISDFDVGIVSEELLNLAELKGLVKTNRPFSLPLKLEEMKKTEFC